MSTLTLAHDIPYTDIDKPWPGWHIPSLPCSVTLKKHHAKKPKIPQPQNKTPKPNKKKPQIKQPEKTHKTNPEKQTHFYLKVRILFLRNVIDTSKMH